jgi:cell division protein FtsL
MTNSDQNAEAIKVIAGDLKRRVADINDNLDFIQISGGERVSALQKWLLVLFLIVLCLFVYVLVENSNLNEQIDTLENKVQYHTHRLQDHTHTINRY